ncbi:PepSY domain-containing protein [Pseudomonas sp. GD03860]|uniref:PepSY domain-containing protein n=1 Tax=Pseudomonas TaxID=286 RepID=UPI00236406A3|nr:MULTISPECIES: PepSY domain-containing protein [Pseudomonas]MDD2058584.1 PepSY domain-containing protein [Pseudomonas putida]MDH0639551.1 PepSY domain-containing protein [Pseudomonas sp. GD03860]
MKRYLYLWHRWLGIVLCLFMALWFVSGVVMLYVGYPKLTPAERLAPLPPLPAKSCCVGLETALAASGEHAAPQSVKLTSIAGAPHYLLGYPGKPHVAIDARNGQRIAALDEADALAAGKAFANGAAVQYLGLVQQDAWSHSRALDTERPFHVVQVADAERRRLYISQHNGRVVRDVTVQERRWNWLGAWLHWLYPLRGGVFDHWAADVVIYLSLAGTLAAILGQVIGLMRWRFAKPYRSGSRSPYPGGFARWHHIGGLLFGFVLIAWIFSGLVSMRPWQLFASQSTLSHAAYQGAELRPEAFALSAGQALARFEQAGFAPRELDWRITAGVAYLVAHERNGIRRVLPAAGMAEPSLQVAGTLLEHAALAMQADAHANFTWLTGYDFYYFPRAEQSLYGHMSRPLPMLRVRFDDPASTWVHIDPYSGEVIEQLDQRMRVYRWLFNLLHSWDWPVLLERPLLREALIIVFSVGGLLISVSGAVLGWRRLRRSSGEPRKARGGGPICRLRGDS